MKTEEQNKELAWSEGYANYYNSDYYNASVMVSCPVWAQWEDEHGNAHDGIIRFLRCNNHEDVWDTFEVFGGFDDDCPEWDDWAVEYRELKWCRLSELNKL